MLCVQEDVSGVLSVVSPQPVETSACTMVVATPAELGASPFLMDSGTATQIGLAIGLLWAVAHSFRAIRIASSQRTDE